MQPVRAAARGRPRTPHPSCQTHTATAGTGQHVRTRCRQTVATGPDCLRHRESLAANGQSPNPIGAIASVSRHCITDRAVAGSTAATGNR